MTMDSDAKAPTTHPADVERKAEIVRVLVEVGNAADGVVAQVLGEFGVPSSVAGTLWALAPGTEPPTMRDVAARLRCDPSTVSLAADKLQSMGLVARQPHPADGRKRTLVLTEQGHELWEALRTRLHSSGLFAGLDAQEQDTLLALLTKMRNPQRP
ncbi:MarR family winged helix-turn-helix transcriptional regulator [Kitasatospora sp. GP82]|uniref:MarR family winged helix-turn-helix transcriptional regulator n=1 Tax=Kitasatospora sp. GP82 TaxID=3035089 RepID=UPI002473DDAC|nr:MarR family winged helix-turn-helix transcriptional regulator [Kitasatospora sp. GP82]MDH6123131.1 DNA-binding MarR family transcriptional regulator [Kitasatospora sp. GP82]